MISAKREWNRKPGASAETLEALRQASPVELPDSYFRLLAYSNGGEGPLPIHPLYFLLYDAEYTRGGITEQRYDEFFPGFVIFGSNGGGSYLAFDTRKSAPWPIVDIDMCNVDLNESVRPVAPDFDSFLELIGRDAPEDV